MTLDITQDSVAELGPEARSVPPPHHNDVLGGLPSSGLSPGQDPTARQEEGLSLEQQPGCLLQVLGTAPTGCSGASGLWEGDPRALWGLCCSLKVKAASLGLPGST